MDRRADLQIAHPRPLGAANGVGEAAGVGVVGVKLTLVGHGGGQAERLTPAPCAEIQHLPTAQVARAGGGDLGAEILDLKPALFKLRRGFRRRGALAGGRSGDAHRRRQQVATRWIERRQGLHHLVDIGLERVDAKVHRRAGRQRLALGGPVVAKHAA